MKVEGGVATTTILHKVKVKEEAKECCGYQQLSSASVPASSTSTGTGTVATATAPNTAIVTTVDGNTNINNVNANGNGNGVVPAATTAPSATVLPNDSPATAAIICHPSTPAPSVTVTVTANAEPFPVDLDLKAKAKACTATRDKPSREDGQPEVHSPSSQHQRVSTVVGSGQQKQSNGPRSEYKGATGCSGSSDNDSPLSSLALKPEFEDGIGSGVGGGGGSGGGSGPAPANCRTEEQNDVPPLSNGTAGTRCIAGVFAGHGMFKRLLGTLVQFATDISPDTGDTVRTLVLALLSGSMAAEEFHQALQEATNYRLRGFVLPYLKHTLPSLQRDLGNAARASNQSSAQFLRSNETAVLEAVGLVSSGEPVEIFGEQAGSGNGGNQCSAHYGMRSNSNPGVGGIQHTGNATGGLHHYSRSEAHAPKRRASDTPYYENGVLFDDVPVYGKRLSNPWSHHHAPQQQQQQTSTESSGSYCWYHPLHSSNGSMQGHGHRHGHGPSPVPPSLVQINQINAFSGTHHLTQQQQQQQQQPPSHAQMQNGSLDDEWKNIHVMLNCILGMVEKTKRALTILQTRGCSSPAAVPPLANASAATQNGTGNSAAGNNLSSTNGSQVESSTGDREGSLKRLSGEIVAQTIKATEDKVAEVKRKAEEAVLEVKRAAVAEVQRAVAAAVAESRASERLRVHRMLDLPMSQRNHVRQGPFLRVHSDTNGRTVATPTTTSNSAASTTEDEKDGHMQSISGSSCWNCGRPALETCGGCGIARYCGSFCQHRDWEAGGHHATCNNPPTRDSSRSASRSPPRIVSGTNEAEVTAPATVTAPSKGK
ncbi:CBFA2/RUNX1 partner transcriptional co-repressor nervy [Megalopta genalis]|uniref:CBFA2/RUNX1 partner transcriptional co-repressor nervy n=1 Tax=Megalopta genalis TaxID=115081 RepID=UPI0014431854|nr:protein CBFA2T3 [Megalopta genalis]